MTVPRRLYPTDGQRVRTSLTTHTSLSAAGAVPSARPVQRKGRSSIPWSSSGSSTATTISAVSFADETSTSDATVHVDPSVLTYTQGDTSMFAYDNSGSVPGIALNATGWYQAQASVELSPVSATAWLALNIPSAPANSTLPIPAVIGPPVKAITSPPFYIDASDVGSIVSAQVYNSGGDTITSAAIYIAKLA